MPDLISIGLGGGSLIRSEKGRVRVGPDSVGYKLETEGLVFGGKTFTATDAAVAIGRVKLGDPKKLTKAAMEMAPKVDREIKLMVEKCIDALKLSATPVPVVLVGGGSICYRTKSKEHRKFAAPSISTWRTPSAWLSRR